VRGEAILLTCEHASAQVPIEYRAYFSRAERALAGHRGYDFGAKEVARALAGQLRVPLVCGRVSRLLVDLNRSETNPAVFSRYLRELDREKRQQLLERFHRPHRQQVRAEIEQLLRTSKRVLHIGVHSFTPVLGGARRNADLGLLYDPGRPAERRLAQDWAAHLSACTPPLRIRRNYPYKGTSDGLTTQLRREYPARAYLGLELEINAGLLSPRRRGAREPRARMSPVRLARSIAASLRELV